MRKIYTLFLCISFTFNALSQESALTTLSKRLLELKVISDKKQNQITFYELEVDQLNNKIATDAKEKARLNKSISNHVKEILVLRGELSDILFSYEKLAAEFKSLRLDNEDYKKNIEQLQQDKASLQTKIDEKDVEIDGLIDKLKTANRDNQVLIGQNQALDQRVRELLNVKQRMFFIEIAGLAPYGFKASLSYGKLSKGGNIFIAPSIGYASFSPTDLDNIEVTFIPVSLQLRVALSDKRFSFRSINEDSELIDNLKFFLSFEGGWSPVINHEQGSLYNRGGANVSLGGGSILSVTDNTNVFLNIGINMQTLRFRSAETKRHKIITTFHIGLGANF